MWGGRGRQRAFVLFLAPILGRAALGAEDHALSPPFPAMTSHRSITNPTRLQFGRHFEQYATNLNSGLVERDDIALELALLDE